MYVQFVHLALGNKDGGVQLVYEGTCCLVWRVIFDRRKCRGVVCVFSIFNAGGSVCGCMCVYMHTHTHCTDGVLGCEPRSVDETPGGPQESRIPKQNVVLPLEGDGSSSKPKAWRGLLAPWMPLQALASQFCAFLRLHDATASPGADPTGFASSHISRWQTRQRWQRT